MFDYTVLAIGLQDFEITYTNITTESVESVL